MSGLSPPISRRVGGTAVAGRHVSAGYNREDDATHTAACGERGDGSVNEPP